MKKFIAYFDYLGYKSFIENNDRESQERIIRNNLFHTESALSKPTGGKIEMVSGGGIPDLSGLKINATIFSDTIVFWTDKSSIKDLEEILQVAYDFNFRSVVHQFPVRGAIVYDEIIFKPYKFESEVGGSFVVNSIFGKGLIRAHEKAEAQDWAGTVLDQTIVNFIAENHDDPGDVFSRYTKSYQVPYKKGSRFDNSEMEYVLRLSKNDLEGEAQKKRSESIRENFAQYNKPVNDRSIQRKIKNTINFLR